MEDIKPIFYAVFFIFQPLILDMLEIIQYSELDKYFREKELKNRLDKFLDTLEFLINV